MSATEKNLPWVDGRLPDLPAEIDDLINQLYSAQPRPAHYLSGAVPQFEMKLLIQVFLRQAPSASIEWGLGSGISAAAFSFARSFLNLAGKHVALDPFQEKFSDNWGHKCLEEFHRRGDVEFHATTSEEFLVQARNKGRKFQFAFIDGAHDLGHKVTDACLVADIIDVGGIVAFHDSLFRSSSLAIRYLAEERGFDVIPIDYESPLKRHLRAIKHLPRLGLNYASRFVPAVNGSVCVLRRSALV